MSDEIGYMLERLVSSVEGEYKNRDDFEPEMVLWEMLLGEWAKVVDQKSKEEVLA